MHSMHVLHAFFIQKIQLLSQPIMRSLRLHDLLHVFTFAGMGRACGLRPVKPRTADELTVIVLDAISACSNLSVSLLLVELQRWPTVVPNQTR